MSKRRRERDKRELKILRSDAERERALKKRTREKLYQRKKCLYLHVCVSAKGK